MYWMSTQSAPVTVLGTNDTTVDTADTNPCHHVARSPRGNRDNEQTTIATELVVQSLENRRSGDRKN